MAQNKQWYACMVAAAFIAAALAGFVQEARGQSTKISERIYKEAEKVTADAIKWRRHIHRNPELSSKEKKTAEFVVKQLKDMGYRPQTKVAGNGVVAVLEGGKPGPTVAARADLDALPIEEETGADFASRNKGVMHACGHDVHTSVLLGVAKALAEIKEDLPGKVIFIFQPAEEAPSGQIVGARLMTQEGVLKKPPVDAIFGMHVASDLEIGKLGYLPGPIMASSDLFTITIRGKRAHGARPWEGIDAIVTAAEVVSGIQTIPSRMVDARKPLVITIGKIEGGESFNILADEVKLEGTVRTLDPEVHASVPEMMEEIVRGITAAHGAKYKFTYQRGAPVTVNDPELTGASVPSLAKVVGAENIQVMTPSMGAEDFAWFAREVPGFYFDLGVRNTPAGMVYGTHTSRFLPDESVLETGIKAMATLIVDYLHRETE